MMINYNLIHNNSLIELLLNFNSKDITIILPVLFLCGVVVSISYIFLASQAGKNIIKTIGTIGPGVVLAITGLESALNLKDRVTGGGSSGNSGGSDKKSDKDEKSDKDKKADKTNENNKKS